MGVRAVVARSFERIHRSNLIGMGVLPLLLPSGTTAGSLGLIGDEKLDFELVASPMVGDNTVTMHLQGASRSETVELTLSIDSSQELAYLIHGGILLTWYARPSTLLKRVPQPNPRGEPRRAR